MYLLPFCLLYANTVIKECSMYFDLLFIYVAIMVSFIKRRTDFEGV